MRAIFFASLRSLFSSDPKHRYAGFRLSVLSSLALFALAFTSTSAHAEASAQTPSYLSFQSALSGGGPNWCIDIPGGKYQSGTPVGLSTCTGTANQTFNTEGGLLTAGGLCLDARGDGTQSTVTMAECNGDGSQTWQIQDFQNGQPYQAIVNPESMCITVGNGQVGQGAQLTLEYCQDHDAQGWVQGPAPAPQAIAGAPTPRVVYNKTYAEPQYYWRGGRRYCWYENGWNGAGWYVCGDGSVRGSGYGGPIWWNNWWSPGQVAVVGGGGGGRGTFSGTFGGTRGTRGTRGTGGTTTTTTTTTGSRQTVFNTTQSSTIVQTTRNTVNTTTANTGTVRQTINTGTIRQTISQTIRQTISQQGGMGGQRQTMGLDNKQSTVRQVGGITATQGGGRQTTGRQTPGTTTTTTGSRQTVSNTTRSSTIVQTTRNTQNTTTANTGTIRQTINTGTIRQTISQTIRQTISQQGRAGIQQRPFPTRQTGQAGMGGQRAGLQARGGMQQRAGTQRTQRSQFQQGGMGMQGGGGMQNVQRRTNVQQRRPAVQRTNTPQRRGQQSDIQLKHDVVRIGTVADGIGLYRFQYNWSDQVYVGVLAQEVQVVRPDAVVRHSDGYLRVYYDRIGAPFQTWERWQASGGGQGAGR